MTVTFEQARQMVIDEWPDYTVAPTGYQDDEVWFVLLLPETAGGRIAVVDKTSGGLSWTNENDRRFTTQRPVGEAVRAAAVPDLWQFGEI